MRSLVVLLLVLALPSAARAQAVIEHAGTDAEFRASCAASATVVWLGGRDGTYAVTTDGGTHWRSDTVPGATKFVVVGLHAVNADTAILLMTSFDGGASRIYRTDDGGRTWRLSYEKTAPGVFFDGLAFWDAMHGVAFGDPVGGHLMIIRTDDGEHWSDVPADSVPPAAEGEAGFAASGTAVAVADSVDAWIGTGGGSVARVYRSSNRGHSWSVATTELPAGSTAGLFAIAFRDARHGVAVGGNYATPASPSDNVLTTEDGGRTWAIVGASVPAGVRYGIVYVPGTADTYVAAGPSGWGYTQDGGITWTEGDATRYNTVTAWDAGAVWLAGPDGRVARLAPLPHRAP